MHLRLLCVCYPGQAFRLAVSAAKWGKEERKGITRRPALVVPWAVNTPHRLHPRLAASIQRSDCRLLYDCLVLFSRLGFFPAFAVLIRPPLPGQQSHCLFK